MNPGYLPFNACDYRCERCLETEGCAVFRKLRDYSLLDEIDETDEIRTRELLNAIRDSFRETEAMIKQKARDFGIDIDQISGGASSAEIREERRRTLDDPLYKRSYDFGLETQCFLRSVDRSGTEPDNEYFDDLTWHHTVVPAKVYRALGWKTEKAISFDARNSAAVAMKSLTICVMAFEHLASRHPEMAGECLRLSRTGRKIKEEIRHTFKFNSAA